MNEDLSIFLDDFGVLCNGVKVLLDEADDVMPLGLEGAQVGASRMVFPTGSLALSVGQTVSIGGQSYRVRSEPRRIDDGAFSEVALLET